MKDHEILKNMDNELLDLVENIRGDESLEQYIYIATCGRLLTEYKIKRESDLKRPK